MRPPLSLAAVSALLLSGCLYSVTRPVNLVSRAELAPAERPAVWWRALVGLHEFGLVERSGPDDVIAATLPLKGRARCSGRSCDFTGALQVILTPPGVLSARFDRIFTGKVAAGEHLLTPQEIAALQKDLDAWVAEVVNGARPTATGPGAR